MAEKPVFLVLFLLLFSGCVGTGIDGPQVHPVPEGLGYNPNGSTARKVFTDMEVVGQRAFANMSEDHTSIMITEFRGVVSAQDVRDARDAHEERWGSDRYRYGEVVEVEIDGRESLGWYEWQTTARKYVAVVPYDDATFTVEVYSSEEANQDDTVLREYAKRFSRDPNSRKMLTSAILAVGVLGLVMFAGIRFTRRQEPQRSPYAYRAQPVAGTPDQTSAPEPTTEQQPADPPEQAEPPEPPAIQA